MCYKKKLHLKKLFLILFFAIIGCKTDKKTSTQKEIKTEIISKKSIKEVKYVTAKSGLIYRDKPQGKYLGKLEFNRKISVIEYTNILQEIKNGDKTIRGEWVGVKLDKNKVVYVFNGFLADTNQEYSYKLSEKYLENGIWVLKDFKEKLYKVNNWNDITLSGYNFVNIIFKDNNVVTWSPYDTEEYRCSLNKLVAYHYEPFDKRTDTIFKILKITPSSLTIEIENKEYEYFKILRKITKNDDFYKVVQEGSDAVLNKWFSGSYVFLSNNNKSEIVFKPNSKSIYMWYAYSGRFLAIDLEGNSYKIHKKEGNTYHLEEVYYSEEADGVVFTKKKAILEKQRPD